MKGTKDEVNETADPEEPEPVAEQTEEVKPDKAEVPVAVENVAEEDEPELQVEGGDQFEDADIEGSKKPETAEPLAEPEPEPAETKLEADPKETQTEVVPDPIAQEESNLIETVPEPTTDYNQTALDEQATEATPEEKEEPSVTQSQELEPEVEEAAPEQEATATDVPEVVVGQVSEPAVEEPAPVVDSKTAEEQVPEQTVEASKQVEGSVEEPEEEPEEEAAIGVGLAWKMHGSCTYISAFSGMV